MPPITNPSSLNNELSRPTQLEQGQTSIGGEGQPLYNNPPTAVIVGSASIAHAGGPYNTTTNQPLLIDGSASTDLDGTITSYH